MKKILIAALFILGIFASFTRAEELNSGNVISTFNCETGATSCDLFGRNITSIASDSFINHSNLQYLAIRNNPLTGIDVGDFVGLDNLIGLYMDGGNLTSIESGSFLGLSNLNIIDLDQNKLTTIKAGTFNGLSSLIRLEISQNQITSIESGGFLGATNLTGLLLDNNLITGIDVGDFIGLTNLDYLSLTQNQISSIERGSFSGLFLLKNLYLNYNQITSIDVGDFIGLDNLTQLNLNINKISSIEAYGFSELSSLTYLNLGYNQINSIESGSFYGLDNLTDLYLGNFKLPRDIGPENVVYNQISSIDVGDFAGLNNLTQLSLDGNAISSIESGSFIGLSFLTYLDLNNNQIDSIDLGDFADLSSLTDLYLYGNEISFIESNSFNLLSSLTYLDLGNNQINSIDIGDFVGLTNLTDLYLYGNEISSIGSNSFNLLSSLTYLDLNSNQINSIESGDFNGLSSLIFLDLSTNQINSIESGDFNGLSSLNELYLSYNQINSIEVSGFSGLPSLMYLYLDNNQLLSIDVGNFYELDNLNGLSLNKNFISSITSNVFDNLLNLWDLSLSSICTDNPGIIAYPNGSTETNNNYCSVINSTNQIDFITELTKEVMDGKITLALYSLSGNYYTGTYAISFTPGITNEILVDIIMQSPTSNYTQDYYLNNVEVQYDSGTLLTTNGQGFTGILQAPVLLSTGSTKLVDNVVALTKFGDATKRIDFSKSVTVRMPALGKNIDDVVDIFYSQNLSSNWSFHGTSTVIDIAGIPYVEFTTDHATYFAIGEGTGSFVINNDDASTNSQNVTLNISGAIAYMRFSNDNSNRSAWESISDTKSRTLSAGTGTKTVYAEFDLDSDFIADISTSDTIEYTDGSSGNGTNGNITLTITGGVTECIYGTSLTMDAQEVKIGVPYTFTGTFPSTWYCQDYRGINGGWTLTIQTTDLINEKSNVISGSNLLISHNPVVVEGDSACTGDNGTATQFYSAPYEIFEKIPDSNKICRVSADNVGLLVNVPANQAPGSYSGTLTLTMNGF
ncbi:hypothetical protein P148_SR1C00001G1027 [candidate division SR1 bacterium RAAC1_SR1_1]|nr:hypothetical protein P148_SR1C00001G1027 [candidate division SR1 bacterium RAAC1_SR1_1]